MNNKRNNLINKLTNELESLEEAYNIFNYGKFLDTIVILRECLSDNDIDCFKTLILQDLDANNNLNYSKCFLQMKINDTEELIKNPPLWIK